MAFTHRHLIDGIEHCGTRHATATEARDCETDTLAHIAEAAHEVCCSICDGVGHGQPGYGPCPLEVNEVAAWETSRDEAYALAWVA